MAKVIGFDDNLKKRVSCKNCSAIILYVKNDVKSYSGTDYGGGPDGHEWVDCPNCGKKAIIRSW
jgi:DNA-directed RNA polymerase subunit RPC12/RpoP